MRPYNDVHYDNIRDLMVPQIGEDAFFEDFNNRKFEEVLCSLIDKYQITEDELKEFRGNPFQFTYDCLECGWITPQQSAEIFNLKQQPCEEKVNKTTELGEIWKNFPVDLSKVNLDPEKVEKLMYPLKEKIAPSSFGQVFRDVPLLFMPRAYEEGLISKEQILACISNKEEG